MKRLRTIPVVLLVVATGVGCGRATPPALPGQRTNIVRPAEEPAETVRIGEHEYAVPRQWLGQKIREPAAARAELVPLPRDLAKDHGLIHLRRDARDALSAMAQQARADGIRLEVDSGFRSSRYQKKIIARQLQQGKSFAEITRFVAPPGYSEHITGTAVDFSPSNWRFASTPQYRWLRRHAAGFGFTETYPKNDPRHPWEPWHWRYHQESSVFGSGAPDSKK